MVSGNGDNNFTRRTYSNVFSLESSMMDFCFKFGWRDQSQAEADEVDLSAEVFMSPAHAKSLYQILGDTLARYEAQFGALPDFMALRNAAQGHEDVRAGGV